MNSGLSNISGEGLVVRQLRDERVSHNGCFMIPCLTSEHYIEISGKVLGGARYMEKIESPDTIRGLDRTP